MKRLIVLLLQAALVAAIVGATYLYTESRSKPGGVVIFSQDLTRHTKITENMVTVVTVPESAVSKAMARDIKSVLGKYTGSEVVKGEPVFVAKLLAEKDLAPEFMMKGDVRKQSFEVDLARSNGGALKPGEYVDLIYYFEDSAANIARSDIFIRKILVLDVRNSEAVPLNTPGESVGAGDFDAGTGKRIPAVITVAVTPEQAKQIVFYKNRGKIDIAVYPEQAAGSGDTKPNEMTGSKISPVAAATAQPKPVITSGQSKSVTAATPDYRTAPNITLPGKVDNGRNR
ncbi:Flp pilus assembly protein CpaB [bacterium]|nr:MAG: Flp pilus assembly protein CpaB [bacterium]